MVGWLGCAGCCDCAGCFCSLRAQSQSRARVSLLPTLTLCSCVCLCMVVANAAGLASLVGVILLLSLGAYRVLNFFSECTHHQRGCQAGVVAHRGRQSVCTRLLASPYYLTPLNQLLCVLQVCTNTTAGRKHTKSQPWCSDRPPAAAPPPSRHQQQPAPAVATQGLLQQQQPQQPPQQQPAPQATAAKQRAAEAGKASRVSSRRMPQPVKPATRHRRPLQQQALLLPVLQALTCPHQQGCRAHPNPAL